MEIIEQKLITSPLDIIGLDIIDFHRLNGVWTNSRQAIETIFSWFNNLAIFTKIRIHNFNDAPIRDDWPGWDHVGSHSEIGQKYWNWFFWNHPSGKLYFSDSPDFYGEFPEGSRFFGDIGLVSASAFAFTQKQLRAHDLWITISGNGKEQILIEPLIDISKLFSSTFPYKGRNH